MSVRQAVASHHDTAERVCKLPYQDRAVFTVLAAYSLPWMRIANALGTTLSSVELHAAGQSFALCTSTAW